MGGSITETELIEVITLFSKVNPTCFVETGTYKAETTRLASRLFDKVHTIEIMPSLYKECIDNYGADEKYKNITFHLGDSLHVLPKIFPDIKNESILWFLDSHQSGADTGNNGKWVPLLEELNLIVSQCCVKPSIFIIDDVRLWSKHWDWEGITSGSIIDIFKKNNKNIYCHFENNDRYIIVTQ